MLASGICDLHRDSSEIVLRWRHQRRFNPNITKIWYFDWNRFQNRPKEVFKFFICKFAAQHYFWKFSMQIANFARQQSFALVWSLKFSNNNFQGRLGHIFFSAKILPQNSENLVFPLKLLFKAPIVGFWNCWISKLTA